MEASVWLYGLIAVAPGIFWLWYFYLKDRYEPEPPALILRTFLVGLAAVLPAVILESAAGEILPLTLIFVLAAPIIEEGCKFTAVLMTTYRSAEFDEPMDGIVYGVAAALGFATLENIFYVFSATSSSEALVIGITRALLSVPGHALFAVPWGYAMGVAKFRPSGPRAGVLAGGLAVGVLFHIVFNFLLGGLIGFALLIVVATPLMWRYGGERIRRALRRE